ncbi:unnamed protein product [Ectocarpus sp. CCAP 1310/34]|nr:unnamed protein product [Ectocarpus sp. CCAP 1310/34]
MSPFSGDVGAMQARRQCWTSLRSLPRSFSDQTVVRCWLKATILPEEHENVLKRKDTRLAGKDNGKGEEVGDKGGDTGERGLIDGLCDLVAKLSMPDSLDVTDARNIPGVLMDNLFVEKNSGLTDVEVRKAIKTWLSVEDEPSVLEDEVALELGIVDQNMANLEIDASSDDEDGGDRPASWNTSSMTEA